MREQNGENNREIKVKRQLIVQSSVFSNNTIIVLFFHTSINISFWLIMLLRLEMFSQGIKQASS